MERKLALTGVKFSLNTTEDTKKQLDLQGRELGSCIFL